MLNKITGEAKVFVREYKKGKFMYTMGFGSAKEEVEVKKGNKVTKEEQYFNWYVPINFSKAVQELVDKIDVKDKDSFDIIKIEGWMSCYRDKNGYPQPVFYINKGVIPETK